MALFPKEALNEGVRRREVFGWAMYDFANSGYTTVVLTAVFNTYFVGVAAQGADWATLAWTMVIAHSRISPVRKLPVASFAAPQAYGVTNAPICAIVLIAAAPTASSRTCSASAQPDEVSIGDYVLSGGEVAGLVVLDACVRLLPGVMGEAQSLHEESFEDGLLEYPHYTRPATWEGRAVPAVLLSGHHGEVAKWRRRERLRRTLSRRPELLAQAQLSKEDLAFLATLGWSPRQRDD